MSSDETSAVSTFGVVEGLPDSESTVLFYRSPQPSLLLSLLFPCRNAGSNENILSALCHYCCICIYFYKKKKLLDKKALGA